MKKLGLIVSIVAIIAIAFVILPTHSVSKKVATPVVSTSTISSLSLSVSPQHIIQGDPVMVIVSGTTTLPATSSPQLFFFTYEGKVMALYGSDIQQATGTVTISTMWPNGETATTSFIVNERTKPQESLPVPQQIGGNSAANQARVVSDLGKENAELSAVYSEKTKMLWLDNFQFPVATPIVTDTYGYERNSGLYDIIHKGVDFHAPIGTPIHAINTGIVRVVKTFGIYGNTIIIDHGLGLISMYMHLSKFEVKPGQLVQKGEEIGLSGETGYAEGPHLHLSIRINNTSIDPMAFFALFGVSTTSGASGQ